MRINGDEGSAIILKEVGYRIKQYRIASNMTQEELADKCRFSVSTVVRIENGEDSKFSNYIYISSIHLYIFTFTYICIIFKFTFIY